MGHDAPRRAPITRPRRLIIAAALVVCVALASCANTGTSPENGDSIAPAGSTVPESVVAGADTTDVDGSVPGDATLAWEPCADADGATAGECATLEAPLDYDDPDGATIGIALYRVRATAERVGTLVVNPGGPAASGIAYVRVAAGLFPSGFDVIGFDPRGVGRSDPVECISDDDLAAGYRGAAAPADDAELAEWLAAAETGGARCAATDLGPTIGTVNVARDLDRIRAAVGDEQISYVGFSYGSRLGWTYATMFPDRVRAMVLDGPEDPAGDFRQTTLQQAAVYEQILTQFVAFCTGSPGTCPDDPAAAIVDVITRADAEPLTTAPALEPLSGTYALNGVLTSFYDERTWADLGAALVAALDGDGEPLLRLSFFWSDQHGADADPDAEPYVSIDAQELISCADRTERVTTADLDDVRAAVGVISPTFVHWIPGYIPPCTGHGPATEPTPEPGSVDVPPILVVSSTGDVATPLAGAEHLVEALGNATLLVRDGPGHTSYGQNLCIDGYVVEYLTTLIVPRAGTTCS